MIHLFPSSSRLGGFFVRRLSGLGFFPGAGLVPRALPLPGLKLDELSLRCGTVAPALRLGFLCVICEASTFFNPAVTPSPLFKSANTAPMSAGLPFAAGIGGRLPGGGGGPGGGGMAPEGGGPGGGGGMEDVGCGVPVDETPDLTSLSACAASTP